MPSWRASIATMWMWSAACRTATQRTASSSWPYGARPVRCMMSQASWAHSSSDSIRSPGAARTEQCQTGSVEAAVAERCVGLLEQAGEVAEVAVAVVAERGFEFGGVAPAGDEVRVGVLLVAARAEEVVDQAGRRGCRAGRPCRSLADPLPHFLGGLVEELGAADAFGRVGEQVAAALAGGVQLRHRLVEVDADAADQAGGADELAEGFAERGI